MSEGHSIEHSDKDDLKSFVEWEYNPTKNALSPYLEKEIIAFRKESGSPTPFTFRELVRLANTGSIGPKPALPFHLDNEEARKLAIRERGADSIREEFNAFKSHFQTYAEQAHAATATLDRLKSHSLDGEVTPQGYRRYLSDFEADLPFLFGIRHFPLPEYMRKTHTYITAGSGMGKSTVLRDMAYHYAKDKDAPSLIIIDPHGSLAEEVAKFDIPDLNDRLFYFKPYLGKGVFPVLNPLETRSKDPRTVSIAAEEFVRQFRVLLRDADSATSQQMESIMRPCVKALMLREKPSTLNDLYAFLEHNDKDLKTALPYIEEAIAILPNPADKEFMAGDFQNANYKLTKLSIRTRLRMLLGSDAIYRCLCGPSTFDLRAAMNTRGSVILFNLSGVGQEVTDTLGRFFTGMIQSIAMERESRPEKFRPQTHFFIDECQRFINSSVEKILGEARKFGLYLTLAQQIVGNGMDSELERVVLGNSGIKVTGFNEHKSLTTMSKNMGVPDTELKALRKFNFYAAGVNFPIIRFKTSNIEKFVSDEAWNERKASQIAKLYREPGASGEYSKPPLDPTEFNHQL